jgi:hypothetical protein
MLISLGSPHPTPLRGGLLIDGLSLRVRVKGVRFEAAVRALQGEDVVHLALLLNEFAGEAVLRAFDLLTEFLHLGAVQLVGLELLGEVVELLAEGDGFALKLQALRTPTEGFGQTDLPVFRADC